MNQANSNLNHYIYKRNIVIQLLMIFSEKTLKELIYPTLRAIVFIFGFLLLTLTITPFLGLRASYSGLLEGGILGFIFGRFVILLFITLLSFTLLYLVGRLCKRKTTRMTYLFLFLTLLIMTIWRTYSFIDGYLL